METHFVHPKPLAVYPVDLPHKLGMPLLLERLAAFCLGEDARDLALNLQATTDRDFLKLELAQVREMVELLQTDDTLPFSHVPSVGALLRQAQVPGAFLEAEEFFRLRLWLNTVRKLKTYLHNRRDRYPQIAQLLSLAGGKTDFTEAIDAILTADGRIHNHASRELASIRERVVLQGEALRRLLDRILRKARSSGWADDKELTLRNDRLVVPILADFKGKVEGFVQDMSASGRTLFIEPVEALPLNNEIRNLQLQERAEIVRILTALTDRLRPLVPEYEQFWAFVTRLDLLRARGQLALALGGEYPQVTGNFRKLDLIQAYHPLLVLQAGRHKVVPVSLRLTTEKAVLVISGPNAGGKTVALQTVALAQLMLQSGLLPPVHPDSTLPVFEQLFLDLGDNQSIQNNLSTYTSHLALMRQMLDHLDRDSLYLLDEFGDGTDPLLGGAIAEALLEDFLQRRAAGIITTHYANLKEFAQRSAMVENASMEFDLETLQPTFQLRQGIPGSSYAIEIARRVGLPDELLERARHKIGSNRSEGESLLVQLKGQETELRRLLEVNRKRETQLEEQRREVKESQQRMELRRKEILQLAREEAAQLVKEANRKIEQTIREIREQQAERIRTKALRKQLAEALPLPEEQAPTPASPPLYESNEAIQAGDIVRLYDAETTATVLELQGEEALLAIGDIRSRLPLHRLMKLTDKPPAPVLSPALQRFTQHQQERLANLKTTLDVRGQRAEAALTLVDRYLDDVVLTGVPGVEILHGKGSGVLRKAIRQHLQARFGSRLTLTDGPEPGPGSGVTLVTFAG